eukprot:gene15259-16834_t
MSAEKNFPENGKIVNLNQNISMEHNEDRDEARRNSSDDELNSQKQRLNPKVDIKVEPPDYYDNDSDPSDIYGQSYLSDEETSSLAGSFDDYGISEKDEDSYPSDQPSTNVKREDKLRRQAVRRHLDQLGELVIEREYVVQKTREQLEKCREHLENLEKKLEDVQEQIEEEDAKGNRAAYFRLTSQYEKLCSELQIEKDLEGNVVQTLEDAEFALCQAYIEHGKFLPLDEELVKEEKAIEKQKAERAAARIKKETTAAISAERKRKSRERENLSNVRERERKHRQALIAAKKNRELAMKYLKETMSRIRQRESEEEEKNRIDMQNRMQALLNLKNDIEGNSDGLSSGPLVAACLCRSDVRAKPDVNMENLHALQARDAHFRRKDEQREEEERADILADGLNPDEVLTRRKRIRQFEKDKEAFERKQREKEIEIVNKILSEEKQMKRKQQQQPQLFTDRQRERAKRITRRKPKPKFSKSSGSESMEYSADVEDTGGHVTNQHRLSSRLSKVSSDDDDFSPYGATSRDEAKTGESEDEILVIPEFKGLWETDQGEFTEEVGENWKGANCEYSAYEQKMMEEALDKQRANIVQKQVAAGREFKGSAFYSKPDVLVFKDFDIGKTYKKKVLLTNVSYSQNFCKFVGISDNLKDFLEIQFDPPGAMSAGLTCDFVATFTPMLNVNIIGQVDFFAQTGPFSVPIKCLKKRCELSVDIHEVNFETQVVGETRRKTITLTNSGALATNYELIKLTGANRRYSASEASSIGAATIEDVAETENNDPRIEVTLEEASNVHPQQDINKDLLDTNDHVVPEGSRTPLSLPSTTVEDSMKVGQFAKGSIAPFSNLKLEIIFAPTIASTVACDFQLQFDDEESAEIDIIARGTGIDVPVWVEREVVDLKICMFDRLFQDAIVVNNRATSALRLTFQVPKELRDYIELLPKTAYIQAESQFSAQLKFLPRHSMLTDAAAYCDKKTGRLDAPIMLRVADQTRPVPFSVKAVVTSSDFEFDAKLIDFGYCTIYESVRKTIVLTNKSVLSQAYGFVGTPETIDVQPNDGFGTLLPEEAIDIDVIFSPKKAQEYRFELTCKSGIGREFKLPCKAIGVLPPLQLSDSLIKFKATAINDTSSADIFIVNSHLSSNEFTHAVPRIGRGPVFPCGPTSFEFILPNDAPITLSPTVGTLKPGEKCMIHVAFSPRLDDNKIRSEAVKICEKKEELECKHTEMLLAQQAKENSKNKLKGGKKSAQRSAKRRSTPTGGGGAVALSSPRSKSAGSTVAADDVIAGSDVYESAQLSLLRSFDNCFNAYKIPCYVAYGECGEPAKLEYSKYYMIYLEVHCPSVCPSVVVISDKGRNSVEFGNVATGQRVTKVVSIQNISAEDIDLKSSALDPIGPFEMVNALRVLAPDSIHNIKLSFTPQKSIEYYEMLEVGCARSNVLLKLKGRGVEPSIELSAENGMLDVGEALVSDTITNVLKLKNASELSLSIGITLGSWLPMKHSRAQHACQDVESLEALPQSSGFVIGRSNLSGLCAFDCQPCKSIVEPGESQEFTVSFSPDHPSQNYADELCINVNGEEEKHRIRLLAHAWPYMTYVKGWDRVKPLEESLAVTYDIEEPEDLKAIQRTSLLTFNCNLINDEFSEDARQVEIGCIKANILTKKSCDFYFENFKEANDLGFTFDPMRGGVDIGVKKMLSFRWKPPTDYDPNVPAHATVTLFAKGDVTLQYKVLLRGYITTDRSDEESLRLTPTVSE